MVRRDSHKQKCTKSLLLEFRFEDGTVQKNDFGNAVGTTALLKDWNEMARG